MKYFLVLFVFSSTSNAIVNSYILPNGTVCYEDEIACGNGLRCIPLSSLCDYTADCEDGSDEYDLKLCKRIIKHRYSNACPLGMVSCKRKRFRRNHCINIFTACEENCLKHEETAICEAIEGRILRSTIPARRNLISEDFAENIVSLITAFREYESRNSNECPLFFRPYNDLCIASFTPAKITWMEAFSFCFFITGDLAILDDISKFNTVLDYMKENKISNNFWIAGTEMPTELESLEKTEWRWDEFLRISPDNPVQKGSLFWGPHYLTNRKENCTNTESVMPKGQGNNFNCLAIRHDNHYYFSDEPCEWKISPLCLTKRRESST